MEYLPGIVLFRLKYVIPFNFPDNLMWKVLLSPFSRAWNLSSEMCINLLGLNQLSSAELGLPNFKV